MRCDYIAEGVIKASKELNLEIPLIVRLKGTKEAEAKQYVTTTYLHHRIEYLILFIAICRMIKDSGLKIIPFDDLDEAAERAVELANA